MKKSLSVFAAFAIALIGYSSCQDADTKLHVEKSGPHKVAFLANLDTKDTKTALELRIVPNWKYTPEANIHLFETYQSSTIEGHDAVLTTGIEGDYNSALLEAEFDEQQSIIVDPPTRAGVADGAYAYTAIIAKQVDSKYVVPAVQNPDDNSSFDPNADFVIGKRIVSETPYQAEPMRLLFERPVALGRLAFYGLEAARDEKILSVKIEAVDPITGYVTYDDIDFDNGTATFNTTDGSNVITMNYGAEGVAQKSVFYAYYIMVPGTHQIKSISLTTDKFVYTKTNAQPATMSFDCKEFKNIAVSMVGIEGVENVDTRADQTIEWKKGGQTISVDSYDLASAEPYVAPVIEGAQTTLTYSSSDETVATVSADGQFTLLAEGETEITATAAEDDSYHSATVKFTLTVTNTPKPESKTFYKVTNVEPGYEYVIVSAGKALANTGSAIDATGVTVSGQSLELDNASTMLWKVVEVTDASLLTAGKYQLTNDGKYLSRISGGSSTSNLEVHAAGDTEIKGKMQYTMWFIEDSKLRNYSSNGGSDYFAYVSSNAWVIKTGTPSADVTFYSSLIPQTLSFTGADNASIDIAGQDKTFKATLNGDHTTVTYTSSNPNIATVASDGTVTAVAAGGPVTITATAAENDEYWGATASYELTVTDSNAKAYVKVTGNTIVEGTYLLVYTSGTPNYAFDASKSSGSGGYRQEVSPSNDRITATDALKSAEVQITAKNGKYFLKTSQGYVYCNNSSLRFSNTANDNYLHSASISNGVVTFSMTSGSSSYNLRYSASSNTFQYGTYNGELTLYLLEGSAVVTKAERNLAFASATVTKTVGDAAFTNTLSGVTTGVSYSSDNEDVATVNATSGLVSIVGAGTAVITASAAEDADYKAGEASFTLTVNSQPTGEAYFVKVTTMDEIVEGQVYIITDIDATRAFKGVLDGTTKFKNSDNTVTVNLTDSKIMDSDALADCKLTFGKHATDEAKHYISFTALPDYLFYLNYNGTSFAAKPTDDHGYSQTIATASNGNFTITRSQGGQTHYLSYYNSAFTDRTSNSQVSIYKLVNGSVPPTPPVTSGVTYKQVTAVTSGKTYLIVSYDDKYALNSTGTSKEDAVTAVSGVISSESAITDCEFVATVSGTGTTYYQFQNASNGYLAYSTTDPYYKFTKSAATGSNNNSTTRFTLVGTPSSSNPTFFFLSEYIKSGSSSATEYLYYKPSSASGSGKTHFRVGASGSSSNSFGGVHLYEKQ